jgi:hypothetical protein
VFKTALAFATVIVLSSGLARAEVIYGSASGIITATNDKLIGADVIGKAAVATWHYNRENFQYPGGAFGLIAAHADASVEDIFIDGVLFTSWSTAEPMLAPGGATTVDTSHPFSFIGDGVSLGFATDCGSLCSGAAEMVSNAGFQLPGPRGSEIFEWTGVSSFQAIPEPGTLPLLAAGLGILGLCVATRRSRR